MDPLAEFDLLLEIAAVRFRGRAMSLNELSAWCGRSKQRVHFIEQRALRKLRNNRRVMRMLEEVRDE